MAAVVGGHKLVYGDRWYRADGLWLHDGYWSGCIRRISRGDCAG